MRLFSNTKKYSLVAQEFPLLVVPGLPSYTNSSDLKYLDYQIVQTTSTDVTIRIIELFDTTPTPGTKSIRDTSETFKIPSDGVVSDLQILQTSNPIGIPDFNSGFRRVQYSFILPTGKDAFENTWLYVNASDS